MDFNLSRQHEMLRNMVREFSEKEVRPRVLELDEKGQFPFDLVKKCANQGLVGLTNTKEYGGSELGHLARMITIEEISRVYAPLGFFFQTGNILTYILQTSGSDEQKKQYLPALCKGDKIGCFALTEATGGSEPANMQTTAAADGGDYVVNGRKSYITLAGVADLICFVAKTGESFSALLVEKENPGFKVTRREPRLGFRSIPINEFSLTNCRIPKANLIGQEGRGLPLALGGIGAMGRTGAAGIGLGICRGAYETALKFARERKLFGKPITQLQAIQFMLVDMDIDIETSKWLCYYCTWLLDQGKTARDVGTEIARAKLFACDAAIRVATKANQMMGAYGLAPEFHLVRQLRDALELPPVAGAQEVMKVTIGAAITR